MLRRKYKRQKHMWAHKQLFLPLILFHRTYINKPQMWSLLGTLQVIRHTMKSLHIFYNNFWYQWPTLKKLCMANSSRSLCDNLLVIRKIHLWLHGEPSPTKKTSIPCVLMFLVLGTLRKHSICVGNRWIIGDSVFLNFALLPQTSGCTIFLKYA